MLDKIVWWIEATWGRYKLYRKLKKINLTREVNCTPFVRQVWYNTCIRKWGVFLCQKEDRINDTQGNSSKWLWRP